MVRTRSSIAHAIPMLPPKRVPSAASLTSLRSDVPTKGPIKRKKGEVEDITCVIEEDSSAYRLDNQSRITDTITSGPPRPPRSKAKNTVSSCGLSMQMHVNNRDAIPKPKHSPAVTYFDDDSGYDDILSIPDPPTPDERNSLKVAAAAAEAKKRKRRLSTPVSLGSTKFHKFGAGDSTSFDATTTVTSSPLEDVTNEIIEGKITSSNKIKPTMLQNSQDSVSTNSGVRKFSVTTSEMSEDHKEVKTALPETLQDSMVARCRKARRSLCHVPSPCHDDSGILDVIKVREKVEEEGNRTFELDQMKKKDEVESIKTNKGESVLHETQKQIMESMSAAEEDGRPSRGRICFADDSDEVDPTMNKHHKKGRKSMFIPDDLDVAFVDDQSNSPCSSKRKRPDDIRKTNAKRIRNSLVLPSKFDSIYENNDYIDDNVDNEDDDKSKSLNAKKSRKREKKSRKSILLPSEVDDSLPEDQCEQGHINESDKFFQSLRSYNNSAVLPHKKDILPANSSLLSEGFELRSSLDKIDNKANCVSNSSIGILTSSKSINDVPTPPLLAPKEEKLASMRKALREVCSIPVCKRYRCPNILTFEERYGYPILTPYDKLKRQEETNNSSSSLNLNWTSSPSVNSNDFTQPEYREPLVITTEMKRQLFMKMAPLVEIMESRKKEEIAFVELATGCRVKRGKREKFEYFLIKNGKEIASREYEKRYLSMIEKKRDDRLREENRVSGNVSPQRKIGDGTSFQETTRKIVPPPSNVSKESESQSTESNIIKNNTKSSNKKDNDMQLEEACDPVMSIPSRNEDASDPEIAAAQRRLYAAIDNALEVYSKEVMAIKIKQKLKEQNLRSLS